MTLYLMRKKNNISATGEYDPATKQLTVLKGSRVSDDISYTEKFRGAGTIERNRAATVKNGLVVEDIAFKSASTAANFVTGSSTNGLIAWKDDEGRRLKEIIVEAEK
jgi:hypothetical protein